MRDDAQVWELARGVRSEIVVEGTGSPVVLVPSLGRDSFDFDGVSSRLVDLGHAVLRPQPRGAGRSIGPMTGLDYGDWAADLAAVIVRHDDGPAVVVGHAAGNRYARLLATNHPDLVRGVVVAATSCSGPPDRRLTEDLTVASDPSSPPVERLRALQRSFFAPSSDPRAWLEGWHPATVRAQRSSTPIVGWHRAGSVPVLDLQGAQDAWRPRSTVDEVRNELGPARVHVRVIENAGHALLAEQPTDVADAIADWSGSL